MCMLRKGVYKINGVVMKKVKYVFLVIIVFISVNSFSESAVKKEASKLLDAMNMGDNSQASISQMLEMQLQQNPSIAPYKDVMLEYFSKYMSYESLKPGMIDIYTEAYTLQELKDINAFYQTPTGKKTITKMPELMGKGAQLGASRVQENIAELNGMIEAEDERIKKLQLKDS